MPPHEVFFSVPLPVVNHAEHCYYLKNGKSCRYTDAEANMEYSALNDPLLAMAARVS